jgi:hypothetical protein
VRWATVRPGSNPGPAPHGDPSKLSSNDEEIFGVDLQGLGGANDIVLCECMEENKYQKEWHHVTKPLKISINEPKPSSTLALKELKNQLLSTL